MAGDIHALHSPHSGAVTGNGVGDFSPSSAESSFRELDDVFLQTQTRIWLGEVLQTRLNEQLHISDFLANGELLFEVSRVISNMLLMMHIELTYVKAYKYETFASRKRGGRYMPYSNVDSFLKICKILGLSGIDLFSPSDVVEKRNTRKVCTCIRSLSKKARSMHLNVPDFDIVTYTVAMPTDMIQCIRRSLESSQFMRSSSLSQSLCQDSMPNSLLKGSVLSVKRNLGSSSEQCYDSEGKFLIECDGTSIDSPYDVSSSMESNLTDSPGAFSVVNSSGASSVVNSSGASSVVNSSGASSGQNSLQLDVQNNLRDEHINHTFITQCLEEEAKPVWPYLKESAESPCSRNVEHGYEPGHMSSPSSAVSLIDISGGPLPLDGQGSVCKASASVSSQGSNSVPMYFKNRFRRELSDADISSGSSSPVSRAVLNFDLDSQLDAEDDETCIWSTSTQVDSTSKLLLPCSSALSYTRYDSDDFVLCKYGTDKSQIALNALGTVYSDQCQESLGESYPFNDFHLWDHKGKCVHTEPNENHGYRVSLLSASPEGITKEVQGDTFPNNVVKPDFSDSDIFNYDSVMNIACQDTVVNNTGFTAPKNSELSAKYSCSQTECFENMGGNGNLESTISDSNTIPYTGIIDKIHDQDGITLGKVAMQANVKLDSENGNTQKMLLLKSVVKGTAILGVMFFLLRLRNSNKENTGRSNAKSKDQIRKTNSGTLLSSGGNRGSRRNGVYPVEKLKLGS